MPPLLTSIDTLLKQRRLMADFTAEALQSDDLDKLMTTACHLVADALGTSRASVFELQATEDRLFARAGVGWNSDIIDGLYLPAGGKTAEAYALRLRQPVTSRDVTTEERFDIADVMKQAGIISLANAPIFLPGGAIYGLLQVNDTTARDFTDDDVQFLRIYCSLLGQVVDRLIKEKHLRSSEEKFRMTAQAATDYAVFVTDAQGTITDWLPGAEAVFGWTAAEAEGKPASIIFTAEDRASGQPDHEIETARSKGRFDDVRDLLRKDGTLIFFEGVTWPRYDVAGELTGFITIGRDQTAWRDADRRLVTLLEGIPQLVWRSAARGMWTWSSPQWQSFTGQTREQSQGLGWLDAVHPDDRLALRKAWGAAHDRRELDIEFRIRRHSDGAYLWHHTRSRPVRNDDGNIFEWLGTSTDIQAMKELQERQEIMVAELQHRTRNLIGVIGSIASQTMAETGSTHEFTQKFNDRLSALSRVQGLLSRSDQHPITIRSLLEVELEAMGAGDLLSRILEGPAVRIRPAVVQTLALALHELASNARKFGALSGDGGELRVCWRVQDSASGLRLLLEWQETGGGSAVAYGGGIDSYARLLVERALPYSLAARTRYELGKDGLRCMIDLPLDAGVDSSKVP
ncbi:PAS domain S-box protein [Paracoccus sediminilitoris]|uniref:PAS domain S-box protein n=1 Tax=Paracoccus sediminilitoris TaxID=2202419 RepID=UPI00272B8289|nr:PAS domain S-box protein [Paracoccus sediminilitoris]